MEFGAKHDAMKKPGTSSNSANKYIITTPGYPFAARELLQELRRLLSREFGRRMTYAELGKMIGRGRSTTHRWFDESAQRQLVALFCFLERLSPERRHAYIDAHCRVFATMAHPRLSYSPITTGRLMHLLELPTGLTFVVGGAETCRTFLVSALGHALRPGSGKQHSAAGIDLHRPDDFVPLPGVVYIDGALAAERTGEIAAEFVPKVLASSAPLLVFNGVWSLLTEWHREILQSTKHKKVIIAEAGIPSLAEVKKVTGAPINIVTVSATNRVPEGIRVNWRCIKRQKNQQNHVF